MKHYLIKEYLQKGKFGFSELKNLQIQKCQICSKILNFDILLKTSVINIQNLLHFGFPKRGHK